jgi:Cd2+/Zn2+-exporting ATPase
MMGGMLVISSFIAEYLFDASPIQSAAGELRNPYSDFIALVAAVLLALPLVWHALKHLAAGQMHMDELVAMAVVAAIALGQYQEAGVIAFFMIIANLIETRTALGARVAIESLLRLTPDRASRVGPDDTEEDVEAAVLEPGDVIRVRPGENIAADGEIIHGQSEVNEASVTGESLPVGKTLGSEVYGGTTNLTGALDVRVTKAGQDTTLASVQQLILRAERTRIPLARLIDKYAGWYTPTIIMLAGIVLFFSSDKTEGLERAITMLIVACPCALVLATPTAMVAALSCAARLGILIKNVVNLEYARTLTAIVFDKTGTLTTGVLSVSQLNPGPGVDGADLLACAASAEQLSKHPAALAMVRTANEARVSLTKPASFEEVSGRGVVAKIDDEQVRVGRSTWLEEAGVDMSITQTPGYEEPEGLSLLYVARSGKCIGWVGLEDRTRPEARAAIDELRELGVKNLTMVTGDKWSVARRVGQEMGCTEVLAQVLPDEKLELVNDLKRRGHRVAVVGDGINDAPALAQADVGIAIGTGTDVAIEASDVTIVRGDLETVVMAIKLSQATFRKIKQNLWWAYGYNVVAIPLAMLGLLHPVIAEACMAASSITVVTNANRLRRTPL